jgi:hypothetical protein
MEFQNVYVLQFVRSFTIYYIKCVCPRIWVNKVYVQEQVKKVSAKNLIKKSFLAARLEKRKRVLGHKY